MDRFRRSDEEEDKGRRRGVYSRRNTGSSSRGDDIVGAGRRSKGQQEGWMEIGSRSGQSPKREARDETRK